MTAADLELIGFTSHGIFVSFGFGFGAVVFFWFLGYVIGAALRAIRLL